MDSGPDRYWRETSEYAARRDEIMQDVARYDEFFLGFEHFFLNDPELLSWEVSGTDLRVMRTNADWGFPGIPDLWIYFRMVEDGKCCELCWIQHAEVGVVEPEAE